MNPPNRPLCLPLRPGCVPPDGYKPGVVSAWKLQAAQHGRRLQRRTVCEWRRRQLLRFEPRDFQLTVSNDQCQVSTPCRKTYWGSEFQHAPFSGATEQAKTLKNSGGTLKESSCQRAPGCLSPPRAGAGPGAIIGRSAASPGHCCRRLLALEPNYEIEPGDLVGGLEAGEQAKQDAGYGQDARLPGVFQGVRRNRNLLLTR